MKISFFFTEGRFLGGFWRTDGHHHFRDFAFSYVTSRYDRLHCYTLRYVTIRYDTFTLLDVTVNCITVVFNVFSFVFTVEKKKQREQDRTSDESMRACVDPVCCGTFFEGAHFLSPNIFYGKIYNI